MMNENKPVIVSYNSPDEVPKELYPNAQETYKNMLRQKEINYEVDFFTNIVVRPADALARKGIV